MKLTKECPRCGKVFPYSSPSQDNRTYCSRACQMTAKRIVTNCPECGKEFWYHSCWPRIYCSRKCSAKNNITRQIGVVLVEQSTCEQCGKKITKDNRSGRRFCSQKCFGNWMSVHNVGPNHPLWNGWKFPYYGPNWRAQRRNARRRDNYTCQRCGKHESQLSKNLDVHHIVPFSKFGPENYLEANKITNLISLCNRCHKYVEHHGLGNSSSTGAASGTASSVATGS